MITVSEQSSLLRRCAHALQLGTWDRDDHYRIRRGSWMQTYAGQRIYPLDPRADEIHFDDICVGLARECRYGNQSRDFYSVGEHSVIVSNYVELLATERGWLPGEAHEAACEGLLHDAAEAYLGDIPRPLKRQRAMRGYCRIEARWWSALCERFDLHPTKESTDLVHEVDHRLLLDEIDALMIDPDMWVRAARYRNVVPLGAEIAAMSWEHAASAFSQRFLELGLDRDEASA